MELPPLSTEQLSNLIASHVPPSQLFEILSQYELQACLLSPSEGSDGIDDGEAQLSSLFYSSFFFAHLLTKQIPEAHALTERMPATLHSQDPSLQNCVVLLRAIWQTQHSQVYQTLRNLPWPDKLQPLVQRYESFFQDQTLIAVSTSYEAIRPDTAANYLGLDTDSAAKGDSSILQKFTDCGWTWNPETQLLYPTPINVLPTTKHPSNGIREAMDMLGSRAS